MLGEVAALYKVGRDGPSAWRHLSCDEAASPRLGTQRIRGGRERELLGGSSTELLLKFLINF